MKCIKILPNVFFIFYFLFSCSVKAESYCSLLWANDSLPAASLDASLDGNNTGIFPVNLQAGGLSTVILGYKLNMNGFVTLDGIVRYWIQYPEEWQTSPQGLKYRIRSDLDAALVQTSGVKTVVTPAIAHHWENTYGCIDVGGIFTFPSEAINGMKVEIDRKNAWPGVYSLSLPIKVAFEENKGGYTGDDVNGWRGFANAMKNFTPINTDNVTITITSKCNIVDKVLNVNMGDSITPDMAKNGVEKKVNVSLTCNALAKVSLSLKGTDIIDGINNKTRCGSGSCTLNFDDGNYNKVIDVNNSLYTVPISIFFQDNNAIPGNFNGSAVLSIDIL
ncbi:nuclease PIN [Escherichia fergusonii]|uniref:nuclease PIN n=1 Tax=Escherichia fergusonii TaxID=564 RepID=UPI001EC5AA40|nr:nuclease PIN [Escherichia fergusonii]EHJ4135898.1 nuclease PIN [Escherichia fergusonii]